MKLQNPVRTFEVEDNEGKAETYRLALNYQALSTLCDLWGIELDKLDATLGALTVKQLPDLVYAAMSGVDESRTRSDAIRFCQSVSITDLTRVCQELIAAATPPEGGVAKRSDPPTPPKRSR